MVIVSPSEYETLLKFKSQCERKESQTDKQDLEKEMKRLINPSSDEDEYVRLKKFEKAQEEFLRRYGKSKEFMLDRKIIKEENERQRETETSSDRQPNTQQSGPPETTSSNMERLVVQAIPQKFKTRARDLFHILSRDDKLDWSDDGPF